MYRYNNYAEALKKQYSFRLQKLSVNAGFTCPNRIDGSGGCTYCNNEAFNPSYCSTEKSIIKQLNEGKEFHKFRYRKTPKYLAYFQTYSNTFADLSTLKRKYEEALAVENIVGLVISTRPDCLDEEKIDYIAELSRKYYVVLEIGIESCYDETLKKINRGHNFDDVKHAVRLAVSKGIKVGGHLIFGLPYETREMIIEQVHEINKLQLYSLKIHQLQIVKGSRMGDVYAMNQERMTSVDIKIKNNTLQYKNLEEYLDLVIDFLVRLDANVIVERVASEVPPRFLLSQSWGKIRNDEIMLRLNKRMEERNVWQGCHVDNTK